MIYLLDRVMVIKIETTFKHPTWVSFLFCPCISTWAPSRKCPWPEHPWEQCLGHHAGVHLRPQSPYCGLGSSKESGAKGWAGNTQLGDSGKSGREADMSG